MYRYLIVLLLVSNSVMANQPNKTHDLLFSRLADRWDEAAPLGNGMIGALVWNEEKILRFSLDRADLWDKRPVENFSKPEFAFPWMYGRIKEGDIESVRELIDRPYNDYPAPTKIPAGRLEFDQSQFGQVDEVRIDLAQAICTVKWSGGVQLETLIHAVQPVGLFRFTGVPEALKPILVPPPFGGKQASEKNVNSLSGHLLSALGYPDPQLKTGKNFCSYVQEGWGGFSFAIYCAWKKVDECEWIGAWSVVSSDESAPPLRQAKRNVQRVLRRSFDRPIQSHQAWWTAFWEQSSIELPDKILENQWYRETYKFGCVARRKAPPISLQAVWTADERRVPPWKGDYHHDLNTQLSYWPCYSGNHLEEGLSFLDWLWKIKPVSERWTRQFYGHDGLNVPGMTTIVGDPMGGWNQYSVSPTTAAWLAHHFYLHWRYSMDREFLKERAYPWIRDCAIFFDRHSIRDDRDRRQLPLSSSPEVHNNSLEAWFRQTTNYDLALVRWLYGAAIELADELNIDKDAKRWKQILSEWPELALAKDDKRLLVAPGEALQESHRHFSHLMAIHPLGLVDLEDGERGKQIIQGAINELERLGPDFWCGYSYSWMGNLCARAREGEKAAKALRDFAECFISINTFHLNGDQSKSGKSKMQYRPFTLEGNFAFAAGVQEMLLQSHTGVIRPFPAIPKSWDNVSFRSLRAEGAFLVSATRKDGRLLEIIIHSERGGDLLIDTGSKDPDEFVFINSPDDREEWCEGIYCIKTKPDQTIILRR